MDFRRIFAEIRDELNFHHKVGKVAAYIPELEKVNPDKYGLHLRCLNGDDLGLGDNQERFSIQSISKVFTLTMAVSSMGAKVWSRVDVEPSGNPFNSLVQLEYEEGIPRNPLINSGAIVIADILLSNYPNPKKDLLKFVRDLTGFDDIDVDKEVYESEKQTGFRNYALANLLKSFGNIENDVEEVLDLYFFQCSLTMSCSELAEAFLVFANQGKHPRDGEKIITPLQCKRINALMQTCGFYDEAGEFSFRVGLPGKSGVGGGIAAVYPREYSVAVWSPRLNKKGNSVLGMKTLELLTTKTGRNIF